jgi:hypothetical protein
LAGLPELRVPGLPEADARVLLASVLREPVYEPVLNRVLAEAGGNPLALLELPRACRRQNWSCPAPAESWDGSRTAIGGGWRPFQSRPGG